MPQGLNLVSTLLPDPHAGASSALGGALGDCGESLAPVRGIFIWSFLGLSIHHQVRTGGCSEGMTEAGAGARACWLGPNLTASPLCQERPWSDVHSVPWPLG